MGAAGSDIVASVIPCMQKQSETQEMFWTTLKNKKSSNQSWISSKDYSNI